MKCIFLLLTLFISACERKGDDGNISEFSFPLLGECENKLIGTLDKLADDRVLDHYEVTKFDLILDSHPGIIGMVKIFSDNEMESEWSIRAKANTATITCYPISKAIIPKNEKSGLEIERVVNENDRLGINSYIVVDGDSYSVYMTQ